MNKLKIDTPVVGLKSSTEYKDLCSYLETYEKWAAELDKVCEEGDVENLEEMLKKGKIINISHEQKTIIKRSLIGIYS